MVTGQLLLLTVVLTLPSVEQLSYRNLQFAPTIDELLGKWYIIRWTGNVPIPAKKKLSPLPPFTFVKNIIGKLEFRMNISQPTGCIEFKMYLDHDKDNPKIFYIWPKHRIYIIFLGGKNFAIAFHVSKINNTHIKMAMLIAFDERIGAPASHKTRVFRCHLFQTRCHNMTPKRTMLLDFEDTVEYLGLNRSDIINPRCDDSCELSRETYCLEK